MDCIEGFQNWWPKVLDASTPNQRHPDLTGKNQTVVWFILDTFGLFQSQLKYRATEE